MTDPAEAGEIKDARLADALGERYLAYALSTIMSRSLPDVRDGLKPVHRRLIYAMRQLRLDPGSGYKKCARIVGDVIGKFHPHGDVAVYEALVRLAQDFSQRYPLIDGQGNFGNIDGDNAAAMRYTESRMTAVAEALLVGIEEDTVDFRPTYDGEAEEPVVLPARFPNLLANGSSGIAVGMATSIPPHNVGELCHAMLMLLEQPDCEEAMLLEHVRGPDFPTGGILVEGHEGIARAYATGRGSFRLRARWEREDAGYGAYRIIVREIPYQVPKARLVERMAELLEAKKLPLLADLRDESTEEIRLVLEPRNRNVDPAVLMEQLFRATDLEVRIPLNLNVLNAHGVPEVMTLRQVLQAFLDHRRTVLERRTRNRLAAIARRLEVLAGHMIVYLNLDEVIRIIREEDDPKAVMVARWDLTEIQVEAILNMRLRALRKLEELEIRKEVEGLEAEQADLSALLSDPARATAAIAREIADIDDAFGAATTLGRRRTTIEGEPEPVLVPVHALIEREPVTVLLSAKGWIRAARGHGLGDLKYKEGDGPRFRMECETTDRLLLLASNGRCFTLGADKLPGGRGQGEPVRLMIELGNDDDITAMLVLRPGQKLLLASSEGRGFIAAADEVAAQTRAGKQVMNVGPGIEARFCVPVDGDAVALVGENRKMLVVLLEQVPEMSRGRGVALQKFREGGLADLKVFRKAEGLSWRSGERTRTETDLSLWTGHRGTVGRTPPSGFPKSGKFS